MDQSHTVSYLHSHNDGGKKGFSEDLPEGILSRIVEGSSSCFRISSDGTILNVTDAALRMFELEGPGAWEAMPWSEMWPMDQRPAIESARLLASIGDAVPFQADRADGRGMMRTYSGFMFPVGDGDRLPGPSIIAVLQDVTPDEIARQAADGKTTEMRHRLRNTYAMVSSMIVSFSRGSAEKERLGHEMLERLSALAAAQVEMVSRGDARCRIADLMPFIVDVYDTEACPISVEDLSDAEIDHRQADALALILGELAVNSDKHGALGSKGSISILVTAHPQQIEILWSERGDRLVEARSRLGGHGMSLMERTARSLGGDFEVDWKANGLDARIRIGR